MVTRRAVSALFFVRNGRANETESGAQLIECWREAGYDCCALWVQHIRSAGFTVDDQIVESLGPMQRLSRHPCCFDILSLGACRGLRVGRSCVRPRHSPAVAGAAEQNRWPRSSRNAHGHTRHGNSRTSGPRIYTEGRTPDSRLFCHSTTGQWVAAVSMGLAGLEPATKPL